MKRKILSIVLALCLTISLLPALTPQASAVEEPISVALGTVTRSCQSGGCYTCGVDLSSSAKMVTISVDSGYFTVPSLGASVLTFQGGTYGTSYIGEYGSDTSFQSAVFSFTNVSDAETQLCGIKYYPDGTAYQTITASASTVAPIENDMYFGGHFYRYVYCSDKISWPDAVKAAGGTIDPYFGGRGYLATVTKQAENSILLRLTSDGSGGYYPAWLGALWQRNTGSVAAPNIVTGTDGDEISYDDVCLAVDGGGSEIDSWLWLLPSYALGDYGYDEGDTGTYIYSRPDDILYYWIDGPEAGQEISNNTSDFAPWHTGEPNNGNFVYIGYEGAYWDDLGLDGIVQKSASGYVVEFSGFGGGSTEEKIASGTKTVAPWSYPNSVPGNFTLGKDGNVEGAGTEANPYAVTCAQDLANLAYWVNAGNAAYNSACYQLANDIVLNDGVLKTDGSLNSGGFIPWTAIGSFDNPFLGNFDGNGHTVDGIYSISTDTDGFQGLFGYLYGGTVKNVGVVDSYIKGENHVGGICGINTAGTVENCYSSGSVTGTGKGDGSYVGGVCGQNASGDADSIDSPAVIRNCYNTGKITLEQGSATSIKAVGGICGKNFSNNVNSAEITNCYNTGAVTGVNRVGGVCGWNRNFGGPVQIMNCYSTGVVTGTGYIGGVCGYNQDGSIEKAYYSGYNIGVGGTGTSQSGTTPFMKTQSSAIAIGASASVVEQTDMNGADKWNGALGSGFAVGYSAYGSDVASVEDNTATGTSVGTGTVTGTMTITQNELTTAGFTGTLKTITAALSAPLTVQKASPTIVLEASPDSPAACSSEITLTAALSGGYGPAGTVTFKNGEMVLGSAAVLPGETAAITYTSAEEADLSITAQYGGDANNSTCESSALSYSFTIVYEPYIPDADIQNAAIIVNGRTRAAGTAETAVRNGRTITTVTVDSEMLDDILGSEGIGATVTIPMTGGSDVSSGVLTGRTVKSMEENEATLVVDTGSATYTLPAKEIGIDEVAEQFGDNVELADIKVEVTISEPDDDTVTVVENAAGDGGFTLMVQPVEFTVTCTYSGRTAEVTAYDAYVERSVRIPDGVDPGKITTAVVVDADGSVHHVPTRITEVGGVYYAVINSLTNSVYALIYNSVEFGDTDGHWARDAVSDMASRKIINGYSDGTFRPDGNITRAEFAAIIVRALGLVAGSGESRFSDVSGSDWFRGYAAAAERLGLISGYDDGTFRPNDEITREQAMTIIARAMEITGLDDGLTDEKTGGPTESYTDASDISDYAVESVAACFETGIAAGNGDGTLAPKSHVTRAEVAVMIQRLLKKSGLI